jgi:hypothetical protein
MDEARCNTVLFPTPRMLVGLAPSAHPQSSRERPAIPQGGELADTRSFISADTPASGNSDGAAAAEQAMLALILMDGTGETYFPAPPIASRLTQIRQPGARAGV